MKKFIASALISLTALVLPASALAVNSSPSGMKAAAAQNRIEVLKERADAEITRRINSINNLLTRINAMKRLTDSDKSNLENEANQMISNLNSLKAKIDGDTDVQTIRKDRQDIFTQYRIYMLFMPQLRIYVAADRILDTKDLMQKVLDKLNPLATTDSQKSLLKDAQDKLNDASAKAQDAINAVKDLKPDEGNQGIASSNRQALMNAKNLLMQGMSDLQSARNDLVQVKNTLRPKTPPSPSPTP
jgi:predicted  nucleic acid-binding Zn-ribbon protein